MHYPSFMLYFYLMFFLIYEKQIKKRPAFYKPQLYSNKFIGELFTQFTDSFRR